MEDPENRDPVIPCMYLYKWNIQSDDSLDKLKSRIVVRGDFQNKSMLGYTWAPTSEMRTLKYFLVDYTKHKARVHQLDFIGELIQANVKHCVFVKFDSIHG